MKALLLAAGLGTRLKPITDNKPKCLVEIGGEPLLGHWMVTLAASGFTDIWINLHHHSEQVRSFLGTRDWQVNVHLIEEQELVGTGGTLKSQAHHFLDASFLMAHADNFSCTSLVPFIEWHRRRPSSAEITMMTFKADRPEGCGVVELDQDGIVVGFHEKVVNPPTNIANGAVFMLTPKVAHFVRDMSADVIDFSAEVVPHFVGRIQAWHTPEYFRDIGTPQDYARVNSDWDSMHAAGLNGAIS